MERKEFIWPDHGRGETKENPKDDTMSEADKKLVSTKAEMDEAIEENRRLKLNLSKIVKQYDTLKTQYDQIMVESTTSQQDHGKEEEETVKDSELVSLSLGRTPPSVLISGSSTRAKEEKQKAMLMDIVDERQDQLSLGLECKAGYADDDSEKADDENENEYLGKLDNHQGPEKGFELEEGQEKGGGAIRNDDQEEVLQQNPIKKARVSVRARCDTPTMNDGCQWRKYGQKIAKGNPCPRAYYRCTVAPSCPVRKQAQRCPEDLSILITTYEGTHNHPLPTAATAMATTTSAAASMLLSGACVSSSSSSSSWNSTVANLQGLNFYLSNNSSKPTNSMFYLPTSSSLSSFSSSHPTITLDLTTSTLFNSSSSPSSSSSSSFSYLLNKFSSSSDFTGSLHQPSRSYTSTNLEFSSNTMNSINPNNAFFWGNHSGSFTNNDNTNIKNTTNQLPYHVMQTQAASGASIQFGRSSLPIQRNDPFDSRMSKVIQLSSSNSIPSLPTEAIKVIMTDPGFKSALATALSSMICGDRSIGGGQPGESVQKPNQEEAFTFNEASEYSAIAMKNHGSSLSLASKLLSSTTSDFRQLQSTKSLLSSGSRSESVSPSDSKEQGK